MKTKTKLIIGTVLLAGGYFLWDRNKKKKAISLIPVSAPVSAPEEAPAPAITTNKVTPNPVIDLVIPKPQAPFDTLPKVSKTYGSYRYGVAQSGCTIYWTNKDGSRGSQFVEKGGFANVSCMLDGSGSGCGQWTKTSSC